jgi:hypothetical protein
MVYFLQAKVSTLACKKSAVGLQIIFFDCSFALTLRQEVMASSPTDIHQLGFPP